MANLVNLIWGGSGPAPLAYSAQLGNQYTANAAGVIQVASNDITAAVNAGWVFAFQEFRKETFTAPLVATVGKIVASAALTNGVLTIANQTDVSRPIAPRIDPGVSAITAGTLTLVYIANDGTTTTDTLTLVAALSTPVTLSSSKGVLSLTSATVAGLVGGTSPKVQIDTNASLAVSLPPAALAFTETFEATDGVPNTLGTASSFGIVKPNTAPNGTHNYSLGYQYYFT